MAKLRSFYHGFLFGSFGRGTLIYGRIKVISPENVIIGKHSTLNEGVLINARARIIIGDYVHISHFSILSASGLDYGKILEDRKHISKEIIIEDGVWIGAGAIVNPGVKIGRNSVIGSGAVVTSDIPENSVAVGVPAKVIKSIYV